MKKDRHGAEGRQGEPPLQPEKKDDAADEVQDIRQDAHEASRQKPGHAADVARHARHDIARLVLVEKRLGKAEGVLQHLLLDVEGDLLAIAQEEPVLEQAHRA